MLRIAMCLLLACSISFAAEPTSLKTDGVVTDELGQPVAGAKVELICTTGRGSAEHPRKVDSIASVTSDSHGAFQIEGSTTLAPEDLLCLRASFPGKASGGNSVQPDAPASRRFVDGLRLS